MICTIHAWEQYQLRVEPIGYAELNERIQQQYEQRDYDYNRLPWLHMAGIWWYRDSEMRLVTCYGRSEWDIPAAMRWQSRQGDRIVL